MDAMHTKVYFSRPGVVCAAGMDDGALWRAVAAADNSAVAPVRVCTGRTLYAARIPAAALPQAASRYDMHVIRMEAAALAQLAPAVAAAKERYGADRVGACVGSCDNGSELSVAGHRRYFADGEFPPDYRLEMQGADYVATFVRETFALGGPALAFATACSSSAVALIKAAQLIRSGAADAVVAGGADIASDTVLLGFDALGAVSPAPTNPFSRNRSGITLGDAAAFFVLSRDNLEEAAPAVTLAGYGESADAYHMTSPSEDGAGAEAAMRQALSRAAISAREVGYVSLHGTGTKMNDAMEARAVAAVLGGGVPCSATKSVTGHTLGAAGALAAAICCRLLRESAAGRAVPLPAQAWDGDYDGTLPALRIVRAGEMAQPVLYCMANAFAFGGANASIILRRED